MWETIGDFIGAVGFPVFVATFVLVRLDPAIRKLTNAITSNTVVTAKSNGMSATDVKDIIKAVRESDSRNRHRRAEDRIDDGFASKDE